MKHLSPALASSLVSAGSAFRTALAGLVALAMALLAPAAAPGAEAQVFPENPPLVWSDDFEYTTSQGVCWGSSGLGWEQWVQDPWYDNPGDDCKQYVGWDNWLFADDYGFPNNSDNGMLGNGWLQTYVYCQRDTSFLVPQKSLPGHVDYDPTEWTNVSLQFDVEPQQFTATGFIWGMTGIDQTLNPEQIREPADGYAFYLDFWEPPPNDGYPGWPTSTSDPNRRVRWRIARIEGLDRLKMNVSGVRKWQTLALGLVEPDNPSTPNTGWMVRGERIYTLRLDWYCGNFRARYVVKWGPDPADPHPGGTTIYGCATATDADGVCCDQAGDVWPDCMEDCWCTIIEGPMAGIDPNPVIEGPGAVALYNSGAYTHCSTTTFRQGFDNFRAWSYGDECGLVCGPWQGWQQERTDVVPFKYLYEGALLDFSAGRRITPAPELGKIDVDTEAPTYDATYNHSLDNNPYCNGWNLLEDLPAPADTTNVDTIKAFLEPMSTAVAYESNSGFNWVADYDNDPLSAGFDPIPLVADGTTPINSSLLEAFDWYVDQKTTGAWATDSYEDCRNWYVVLITDGEEGCEFEACSPGVDGCPPSGFRPDRDRVCDAGQAASKFAEPGVAGVPSLPVYTIGFSESIQSDSPLQCIADQTGGLFLTAENAGQLADALYEVFYRLETGRRSFSPFKVAPPPSSTGGNPTRDSLAVYPLFQPQEGFTLWGGNLFGFPLNSDQPTLPVTGDCEIDESQMVWNAAVQLGLQLAAHTESNPKRFVYMGSSSSGTYARHDLATLPLDSALMTDWKSQLGISGISDVLAQQVANFARNVYMDNDTDPANSNPPSDPRPGGYPVFGEFYHSQPVIINPPNSPLLYYDYGYGNNGYADFIEQQAKRRRMVVAGANDGMLHIFDGGFWDRNRGATDEIYNEIHDLGTGIELAAWIPRAVMDRMYYVTAGGALTHQEPQYLVDGPTAKGDVRIDADGDGDKEWRTIILSTMRRGGRGVLALDVTQPDPNSGDPDYTPSVSQFAGCRVGTTTGCDGFEWPRPMWEFADETDADSNCPSGLSGDDCAPYWDLGWTWSKPAIARIAKYNPSPTSEPDDVYVAFFGGGWDETETDATGRHFYGIDIETGAVVVKEVIGVDLPGGVTALDSDIDGFHDRIYFADTNGGIWRLGYASPTDPGQTGPAAGTLTQIYDFSADFVDRQEFFMRPVPVPVLFDGNGYTWALGIGSGDRANLDREDSGIDHFYFVIDGGDGVTRDASALTAVGFADLDGNFTCPSTTLDPPNGKYGWYLSLRDTEKVMFDCTVIDGYVLFPTFDPSTDTATHNVPDQCDGSGGGGDPIDLDVVCRASGIGRTYKLWYECGLGDYSEHNDIITGSEDYSIGGDTFVTFTGSVDGPGQTETFPLVREHSVTNWRQE